MTILREISLNIKIQLRAIKNAKRPALIIYGPRQVGKTTLIQEINQSYGAEAAYFNCDFPDVREQFSYDNVQHLKTLLKGIKILSLDEAQRIQNIGLVLKILVDNYPDVQVLATGSSSFELSNQINEPLTGRKVVFHLYPFSFLELYGTENLLEQQRHLPFLLRFGSYPDVVLGSEQEAPARLHELTDSYLFKDIFNFQQLRKSEILVRLLRLLAFQIGSEVSFQELASQLGIDQTVVQKYIHLLEEAFVIFRLGAFKKNLRTEVSKSRKIYFWDLGIRNALINNFNTLTLRDDVGALWENFCISERLKKLHNQKKYPNTYFWRTYQQKEIDYIEEADGVLDAYEFKWSSNKKSKLPAEFIEKYQPRITKIISPDNFVEWLSSY